MLRENYGREIPDDARLPTVDFKLRKDINTGIWLQNTVVVLVTLGSLTEAVFVALLPHWKYPVIIKLK